MKMSFPGFILMFLFTSTLISCDKLVQGTGPIKTSQINIRSFSKITSNVSANIKVSLSDTVSCSVTAQENIVPLIEISNSGNELIIKSSKSYETNMPVDIIVSTKMLEEITLTGSGNIDVLNPVKSNSLKITSKGSGNILVSAYVETLKASLLGSGEINLKGSAGKSNLEIKGSGSILASSLSTNSTSVVVSGSGNAEVNAVSNLNAEMNGSGLIQYKGNPVVKSRIDGSGEIKKSNN